ncbi:hypothetical protein FSP39_001329 [Pinctada imbricata]|uniref:Mitochondrial inner membrane protein Mpv17 n=1 Tax=Pinctada imbricata TaxID=66713 RepID=A0AA88XXY6_PINIB|nr:hypothetical protein FSP39_001329 [Pinctada imbricata]
MTLLHTMVQYATLWTIADITEQKYISKKLQHDWHKTYRMATVGTLVVAPLVFGWIRLAERISPGKHWFSVFRKVLMDQVVFAPIAVSSFYASTCFMERKSLQQFQEEWKKKFPRTYINGMKIWPAVQLINFSFVPIVHRPKVISCVSFGWSIYLCFQKEDAHNEVYINIASLSDSSH